jgi:hypothetical protein
MREQESNPVLSGVTPSVHSGFKIKTAPGYSRTVAPIKNVGIFSTDTTATVPMCSVFKLLHR